MAHDYFAVEAAVLHHSSLSKLGTGTFSSTRVNAEKKKNTFTQAKVLRENEIVIVRLPNKSCDLICLKINNPRWASNAVSGVSLQVQHLQEAINLALASEIAPLAPLAPLLHNPDRSRSARRREASPWSRHVWFVLEGEGGGDQSHYCSVYFYKELENVGRAPRGDVPSTSRAGSLIEVGENFNF